MYDENMLKSKLDKFKSNINEDLNSVDVDKIKIEGMSIRIGGKIVLIKSIEESPLTIEDEIRSEFKEKINEQQKIVRDKVNFKINEIIEFHNQKRIEYKRKEEELEKKLKDCRVMPDITFSHAEKGLSIVKGSGNNDLIWLVQGIYWPKYVDGKEIEKKFSKKMITNIIFMIKTKGEIILEVSTRKPIGLSYFSHYHQSKPDCWGRWHYKKEWKTPDDIIKVARDAEAVLENINTGSIANHSPNGLPRKTTILNHIVKNSENQENVGILNQQVRRSGIVIDNRSNDLDIWSL